MKRLLSTMLAALLIGLLCWGTAWGQTPTYYVSSSTGSDTNDGLSELTPFATITKARDTSETLAAGTTFHVLLKRGDDWLGETSYFRTSGESMENPIVFAPYGEGDRPILEGLRIRQRYYHIHDLMFTSQIDPDGSREQTGGLTNYGELGDVLVEDCRFHYAKIGLNVDVGPASNEGWIENITIRDCVVQYEFGQGLYPKGVVGLVVEDCFFDHCGWSEVYPNQEPNIYKHNIYVNDTTSGVVIRNSIFSRASSHGVQLRPGGILEDCIFIRNSIHLSFAYVLTYGSEPVPLPQRTGTVRRNIFVESKDISATLPRGIGIETANTYDAVFEDNLIAFSVAAGNFGEALQVNANVGPVDRMVWRDNIVHDHKGLFFNSDEDTGIEYDVTLLGNYTSDLTWPGASYSRWLVKAETGTLNFQGNRWYSAKVGDWFEFDGVSSSTAGNDDIYTERSFPDPGAGIPTDQELHDLGPNWNGATSVQAVRDAILAGFGLTQLGDGPGSETVPDVVGMTQAEAETTITDAGLAVGTVTEAYDDAVAAGLVVSQDPAAGASISPGGSVSIVVSLGPDPNPGETKWVMIGLPEGAGAWLLLELP